MPSAFRFELRFSSAASVIRLSTVQRSRRLSKLLVEIAAQTGSVRQRVLDPDLLSHSFVGNPELRQWVIE